MALMPSCKYKIGAWVRAPQKISFTERMLVRRAARSHREPSIPAQVRFLSVDLLYIRGQRIFQELKSGGEMEPDPKHSQALEILFSHYHNLALRFLTCLCIFSFLSYFLLNLTSWYNSPSVVFTHSRLIGQYTISFLL